MEREPTAGDADQVSGSDRKGCSRGFLVVLLILVLLFLAGAIGLIAPAQLLWLAATGWFTFLWRVIPEISINWEMIICGIVALGLALALGHRFLRWLADSHPRLPSPWPFKLTASLTALLLLLFGASIAMTGIVHQLAWLANAEEPLMNDGFRMSDRMRMAESIHNGKMLKISLEEYAMDHDGHYPERLEDLVSSEILEPEALASLRLCRTSRTDPGTPWTYFGAGITNTDDPDTPILISPPFPPAGRIIVLRLDWSAKPVHLPTNDPKLQELLER